MSARRCRTASRSRAGPRWTGCSGGRGVIPMGAIGGMAHSLEGRAVWALAMPGRGRRGGAVFTPTGIPAAGGALPAVRVPTAGADLLLAADLVVATEPEAMTRLVP